MYLFEQLFQYLNEYYFSSSLGSYDNFDIHSVTTLLVIIGGLCLGLFLASVIAVVQKKHIGKMARALLSLEANSPESAKTLYELGLSGSVPVKIALSHASPLRKLLSIVEGDEVFTYQDELAAAFPDYKKKIDAAKEEKGEQAEGEEKEEKKESLPPKRFRLRRLNYETARFFIDPSLYHRTTLRYEEKGSSWWIVLLSFVASAAVFLLALRFLPVLVSMLDATISNFKNL